MASNPANLPKAPVSAPAPALSASTTPMSTSDVARAFDLVIHFLTMNMFGQSPLHPDDMNEFKAISARIRASSNL